MYYVTHKSHIYIVRDKVLRLRLPYSIFIKHKILIDTP